MMSHPQIPDLDDVGEATTKQKMYIGYSLRME